MKRARVVSCLLLALLAPFASGCELVADFDRSRIPEPTPDGGSGGGGSLVVPDSGRPPAPDAGPSPTLDAGPPALDAGPPPTPDAGGGDAGLDAG